MLFLVALSCVVVAAQSNDRDHWDQVSPVNGEKYFSGPDGGVKVPQTGGRTPVRPRWEQNFGRPVFGENVFLLPKSKSQMQPPKKAGVNRPQELGYGFSTFGPQPYVKLIFNPNATPRISFEYGITQLLPAFMKVSILVPELRVTVGFEVFDYTF
ncbi:basic salivary proline-rich 3-like protein [Labeo rohita]|uniref:Basic salivary proline-rich 3-like protein n=1 Tax=Labeo rohita TaxID=84645 RepID=A0A498MIS2_LABRO|nr:basic salivary proline-rich 3-like protein [Labeo rohita]